MSQKIELPDLLTVAEAADYLSVPKSWIYERTRHRACPVRKLGNHVRIPRNEFLAWIDADGVAVCSANDKAPGGGGQSISRGKDKCSFNG